MPVANARSRVGTPYKPPTCIARLTIGILLPAGAVRASKRDSTAPLYWSMTTQLRPGTVESAGNFICTTHEPVLPLGGTIRARLAPGSWVLRGRRAYCGLLGYGDVAAWAGTR